MKAIEFIENEIGNAHDNPNIDNEMLAELFDKYAKARAGHVDTIVIGDSWISTDDKLPEKGGNYLIYGNCTGDGERVDIGEFWNGQFEKHNQPTHWRLLPDIPKSQ